jgi:hypothetical protein
MLYIERYMQQREDLRALIQEYKPDAMGLEYPVFDNLWSEGMYGLFLFTSEALRQERQDVVFFSPGQIKARARLAIERPPKWKMDKPDMVEAAKTDLCLKGALNHNMADAYWCAVLAGGFWKLHDGTLAEADLNSVERETFLREHTYKRGKHAGQTLRTGLKYREDDRFHIWSEKRNGKESC